MVTTFALVWLWFGQAFVVDHGLTYDDCAAVAHPHTICALER